MGLEWNWFGVGFGVEVGLELDWIGIGVTLGLGLGVGVRGRGRTLREGPRTAYLSLQKWHVTLVADHEHCGPRVFSRRDPFDVLWVAEVLVQILEMGDGRWEIGDWRWEMGNGRLEIGECRESVEGGCTCTADLRLETRDYS